MLAFPCANPRKQGCHDGIGGIQAGCQVGDCYTDFDWGTVSCSSDVHQSHLSFNHDIVPSTIAIRPCLAIASDTGIDQLWIYFMKSFVVHAIFGKAAWEVVLHQNITFLCEFVKNLDAGLVLEGQPKGLFIAVDL
jgi:hypothetical protein